MNNEFINEKINYLKENYKKTTDDFINILLTYIKSKKIDNGIDFISMNSNNNKLVSQALDVNGLGTAISKCTINPKKKRIKNFNRNVNKMNTKIEKIIKGIENTSYFPKITTISNNINKQDLQKINTVSKKGLDNDLVSKNFIEKIEILSNFDKNIKFTDYKLSKIIKNVADVNVQQPQELNSNINSLDIIYMDKLSTNLNQILINSEFKKRNFIRKPVGTLLESTHKSTKSINKSGTLLMESNIINKATKIKQDTKLKQQILKKLALKKDLSQILAQYPKDI